MSFVLQGQRLSVAIILITLAVSGHLLARGATSIIAGKVLPPEPVVAAAKVATTAERPPGADPPDIHAILGRNIFDPATGSLWPPKPVDMPDDAAATPEIVNEEPTPGVVPPACDGSMRLVASVFSERAPEWSFASVTTGSDAPMLYRQGSRVQDKELVMVMPSAIYMRSANGRLCSLMLFVPPPVASAPSPADPVAAAAPPGITAPTTMPGLVSSGSITETELDQGIKAEGETKFTVQRSFVDKVLQNQAEIMRSARIVPHEENGQVMGVKLYGIRRNSLLGKLGLQNGDLLRTINGFNMSSPDTALEAYAKLRTANNLSVAVVRRGRPLTVDYDIQQ